MTLAPSCKLLLEPHIIMSRGQWSVSDLLLQGGKNMSKVYTVAFNM